MVTNLPKFLTFAFFLISTHCLSQEIWKESFSIPEKGIWGNGGAIQSDFSGITEWFLEYQEVKMVDAGDYAKTVSTSGGRFEVSDIAGEVKWLSKTIQISEIKNINVSLLASETGSGANITIKYLKAYYRIDNGNEIPFTVNGVNEGNWSSVLAEQNGLIGNTLQIVVRMANSYSSDKVILDEVVVSGEKNIPPIPGFGIVINELMADPTPVVGLPEAEYIELYSTLSFEINLENWILRINGVEKKLQKAFIQAGGFLVLCATGSLESLKQFGNVINVVGFQGLLNSGATVELLDDKKNLIDRISYTENWYHDLKKDDGGWSLEKIDPLRNCNSVNNWQASTHPKGGTPGTMNSVNKTNPDLESLNVSYAVAISENQIEAGFQELMDTLQLKNPDNYTLKESGKPINIKILTPENVILYFAQPLIKNKIYNLVIQNLTDDCGNKMAENTIPVQWNTIEPGDLAINEILFNPTAGGEDYVELYNRSQKIISINQLSLASRDELNELKQVYSITQSKRLIYPGEYLVLTKDTNKIFPWFTIFCRACFQQMDKIPSFNDDKGNVGLMDKTLKLIDEFSYDQKMHSGFLSNVEGVSLERVSVDENTNQPGNWQSASSLAGFGTPGYKNSQAGIASLKKPRITFEPESFSPDNDGFNDEYIIQYQLDEPTYSSNIYIFDSAGRLILQLVKNELLGTEGTIKWNGSDKTGRRFPLGVYVVMVEIFNTSGKVSRFKDGIVLTESMK